MKLKSLITLLSKSIMNILINYVALFNNRDFLFELEFLFNYNLNSNNIIFAYIIDFFIFFI